MTGDEVSNYGNGAKPMTRLSPVSGVLMDVTRDLARGGIIPREKTSATPAHGASPPSPKLPHGRCCFSASLVLASWLIAGRQSQH